MLNIRPLTIPRRGALCYHRTGPKLTSDLKEAERAARDALKAAKQAERDSIKAYHEGIRIARKTKVEAKPIPVAAKPIVVPPSPVVLAPSIPCLAKSATLPAVPAPSTHSVSNLLAVPNDAKSAALPAVPPAPSTQHASNLSTVAKKPIVKKTGVWPVRPKLL